MLIHTYHAEEVVHLLVVCTQAGHQSLHACLPFLQLGPISYARSFLRSRDADHVSVGFVPSYRHVVYAYLSAAGYVRRLHCYGVAAHRGHRQMRS